MPFKKTLACLTVSLILLFAAQVSLAQKNSAAPSPTPSPTPATEQTPNSVSPTTASAENTDSLPFMKDSESANQQAPSAGGMLLRTLGALLLIVGIVIAGAWAMKRFGGARFGKPADDAPELAVLNSVGLGEKRSLAIVRFGERTLLIGSTPQSISLLAETQLEESEAKLPSVAEMLEQTQTSSFAEELSVATTFDRAGNEGAEAQW